MAEALEYPDSDFSDEDQSSLDASFNKASNHVRKLTDTLNNNQLLELYSLYKQSTEGKCNTPRPGWFHGRGRKKWDAWNALDNMSSEEAKSKYIELVQRYDPDWSEASNQKGTKESWVAMSSMIHEPEPELNNHELSLFDAARENIPNKVTELLISQPGLKNDKDENGLTALHWAADRDAVDALIAAIKGGCDINAVDNNDQTALHYSASCGHMKSTKILLEAGALFLKDDEGFTPLEVATDEDIKVLLQSYMK